MGGTTHTLRPKSYQTSSFVSRTYILSIRISTPNIFRQSFSKLNRSLTMITLKELIPDASWDKQLLMETFWDEGNAGGC